MTIFDNMKTNDALCEGVGPHRPRMAAPLLERSGKARALSFARCRPRGPPGAY
jgi:hypothetical protein